MTTADLLVQSGVSRRRLLADRVPSEKVESGEHLLDYRGPQVPCPESAPVCSFGVMTGSERRTATHTGPCG